MRSLLTAVLGLAVTVALLADGPQDNKPDQVRPVPPPGVKIPDADRAALASEAAALEKEIQTLRNTNYRQPDRLALIADVEVYHKAVDWALKYDEFYNVKEVAAAKALLQKGRERAQQLKDGKPAWTTATGLVVRGYVSKIDGSVQPYGLVVPATYKFDGTDKHRLDFWCHGRGETLTELAFIDQRQRSAGEFTPPNAFVLHLYGRYCNANKFAGEIDLFEALADVKKHYRIDPERLVIRGFSMGGAACWQFAVHYPTVFCAAAPGAGFAETPEFLRVFQNEPVKPAWYEQALWHWYNATDYAGNLYNLPTVAYSGEIDKQKQAADVMAAAMKAEGLDLVHVIGPQTAHKYEPKAKEEVNRRIDALAAKGRDPLPKQVKFTTWTLRYNESAWVRVDGLGRHWERARVDAQLADAGPVVQTTNVTALTLNIGPGLAPFANPKAPPIVKLDGQAVPGPAVAPDKSWLATFRRTAQGWEAVAQPTDNGLAKRHGLQGPIDDAFLDKFLMVRPTGQPLNEKVGAWARAEMVHAQDHWRRQFRGDAPVKDDAAVTEEDIASANLVLWGDPQSNRVLARIADKLPVKWGSQGVQAGPKHFAADHHVPVLIYPNPLNPKRYVVLNSGFTFREYDYLNNARQVPKLPDWAVIDVSVPVSSRTPGGVAWAGFFGEHWEWQEPPAAK